MDIDMKSIQLKIALNACPLATRGLIEEKVRCYFDGDSAGSSIKMDISIGNGTPADTELTTSTGGGHYYYWGCVEGYQVDVNYVNWRWVPETQQCMFFVVRIVPSSVQPDSAWA